MAGGGVPTQYKGREHVWHAMVDKFAKGGAAQPAALIDGNEFVKAAQANGLKTDNVTLNKIVARVNNGEGVQEAAKNVAQFRADGGEVQMGVGGFLKGMIKGSGAKKVLSAAEREVNKAKFMAESEDPRRMYHGTQADIQEFKKKWPKGAIFVSPDPAFASKHSRSTDDTRSNVMPVRVQVKNPFDYENPAHIEELKKLANKEFPEDDQVISSIDLMRNFEHNWPFVENSDIQRLIQQAGHDSFYVSEKGTKNLGIYDPNRIKSDISNRGTYDINESDITKARGGEVQMAGGGDPLDQFSPPRYRSAGRRPEGQNDRRAAANMPIDFARGVVSGIGGAPGDIESLIRMLPGFDERTVLPTSEDIEKRIPLRSDTPAGRAAAGLGTLAGGFYTGPGAPIRLVGGLPQAVYKAGKDFGRAAGQPVANVVKPTGGNFLTRRTEKDLSPLKRHVPTEEHLRRAEAVIPEAAAEARTATELDSALNNWVDSNLTNYVKKQMGTADDPVRLMFDNRAREIDAQYAKDIEKSERIAQRATGESDPRKQANLMREAERIKAEANLERQTAVNHISHKPALLDEYLHEPLSGEQVRRAKDVKKQRRAAGFPEEGLGQSPMAKAWEISSDEVIASHRAGDIQGMSERFAKFTEAENKMRAARNELDEKFKQHIAVAGLNEKEAANLIRGTAFDVKAKMVGDTDYAKANTEYLNAHVPMMDNYMELGRQNPYINKLDPETPMYAAFTGDLGFDHIMDVLREDLTTGRIRPDQMNKVSITDAIRRTSEYDRDLADKMNASRATAREGLPTYREYPEGYKWIELNKPGAFAQESEAMGHSVRGYEPPKGHPDWVEGAGDAGSSNYGHGGWEAIKSGKAKVYSLVDSKGAPHATVEVGKADPSQTYIEKQPLEVQEEFKKRFDNWIYNIDYRPSPEEIRSHNQYLFDDMGISTPSRITQIKGKQNAAPNKEYLPYVQDFVKGGQWSEVGDLRNTGLRDLQRTPKLDEYLKQKSVEVPRYLDEGEYQKYESDFLMDQLYPKNDPQYLPPQTPEGMAGGGAVRMGLGGAAKIAKAAAAKASKKVLGAVDEVPKGVEPIVVRTPEERAVIDKFGQKKEQEAARKKKVEKAEKLAKESAGKAPEESVKPPKSTGKRVAVPPDVYRKMAEMQGDDAVLKAARAGKHLKPTGDGYIGGPRTVTSSQGLGAMRKGMDTDFADAVEAVRLADPERLGTWYDRAKQGIAESTEPYQLPRTLEQHAVYSAGVSPESELTFALKHLNSRVAGEPGMAYRGAGMRNLDEAVAEGRPANLGFKIGEYGEKNDPRVPNTGLFGVNDFRRAQGMTYTDPQGNPWKAGVSDTMHPFMDAETALQVDRANTAGTGGRTDWQGPHIQEVPWVYGKAQDLHGRGLKGRYAGDELEGIKMALRDANNTARDYFYKNTGSATHEAIPGASTGHLPQMIDAPYEQKVAYGNIGRWDMPAPEYALSDMGTVGAGNRDAIYGALGYRQLPTIEASGAYFPEGSKIAEHQPVKIARPLLDFPTGGGGLVAEPTRQTMNFAERFRALGDAQEAFGYNLPNTMADVKGKNSLVLDTRGANPRYLDEPHTGVMPDATQMGALSQALGDVGYGVAPTSRGATVFPFDSKATAADARRLMKDKGSTLQQIYPSEMEPSLNTSGYGPGVGMYTPQGFQATEPFSGQATMGLLKEASYLPPEVAINLGESELVRSRLKAKMERDAALPNARADIQETRRFFSEADWPKAVALIRQGYTPAAALIALGYSASSMAEDRR